MLTIKTILIFLGLIRFFYRWQLCKRVAVSYIDVRSKSCSSAEVKCCQQCNLKIMCIIYHVVCVSLVIQNCPNYAIRLEVGNILLSLLYSTGTFVITFLAICFITNCSIV